MRAEYLAIIRIVLALKLGNHILTEFLTTAGDIFLGRRVNGKEADNHCHRRHSFDEALHEQWTYLYTQRNNRMKTDLAQRIVFNFYR